MTSTYTITPHHDSQIGGKVTATSYREARRIARSYRDGYYQGVSIERDGSHWYRAAI